jgi:hypothetical protein
MSVLAQELLDTIRAAGGEVRLIEKERLKLVAPAALPDELVERVRVYKRELLETLIGSPPMPADENAPLDLDEEERAAIVEHDGGAPRAWAEAFAKLHPDRPPQHVTPRQWSIFVDDCGRFIDRWAVRASALGLNPGDLFGWDTCRPFPLIAVRIGLGWRIEGRTVVEVTSNAATVLKLNGQQVIFRRPGSPTMN